ncbi:MAG: efflux RND transporter periplasmic adaptor subunit [Proteobacteria bacterium]|nr:efflux RND transporter periplasmic adaptor subunit [Pseudomonadota bacterium]
MSARLHHGVRAGVRADWSSWLLLVCAMLLLGACTKTEAAIAEVPSPRVETTLAVQHQFEPVVELTGEIRPASEARLVSEVAGTLAKLMVEAGDQVVAGALVAQIDDVAPRASLKKAEAAVEVARASLESTRVEREAAQVELDRTERLKAAKVIDARMFENARSRADAAAAQVNMALANLKQTEADVLVGRATLRQYRIAAPISGIVVKRHVRPHEYLGKDKPIVDLIDTRSMELVTSVPAVDARALKLGAPLRFRVGALGDQTFEGRIVAVIPQLDGASRTLPVRAAIANPKGQLMDGMFAVARVPTGASHVGVAIPQGALRGEGGSHYVWAVRGDVVERVAAVVGAGQGGLVEIGRGVAVGDELVLAGAEELKPGMRVTVAARAAASAAEGD